ncbi:transmembrane protein [Ketogulonicigenium robustum]|uniref:Probable membrane transporter protein n=1 Tax=Ketogulonicigenium robustum TaxID=92947 RepID=A0A1W6NZW0_9RHOB|nr:sulfite exporter TauE/SafE family protein [Ketogulonicigenium robustum]ARO14683.1 transmembrane protein [Ketogulonicigenium robustum]
MFEALSLHTLLPMGGALVIAGALSGLLAGLFGIGGGAIAVPVLYEIFRLLGIDPTVAMPLAVGTSLAIIVPTSFTSARGHYQRGTLDLRIIRLWAFPVVIGVVLGAAIARIASPAVFQIVFIVVASVNAVKMLTGGGGWQIAQSLPGKAVMRVYGFIIGVLSSLMGIGGGTITNLVLTLYGIDIRRAISTAAGVGTLIALPGAIGYMIAGWGKPGLPPDAIGYVSTLAFLITIPTTVLVTPLGVRLAHTLPRRTLEVAFGVFLLLVSSRFVFDLVFQA